MKKVVWGVLSTAKISLPYAIENAIHGMRVIDALFRSEASRRREEL